MDQTNCPNGWASDRVMLYGDDFRPDSCDVNIALYVGLFSGLTIFRTGILLFQIWVWKVRSKKRNRYPIVLIASAVQTSALFLFTLLTSLNIANASNGGSSALLGLYYFVLLISGNIAERKLLRLGYKLIPLSHKTLETKFKEEETKGDLVKMDSVLKIVFLISNIPFILLPVFTIILGCIVYPNQYFTAQAAFACYVVEDVVLCGGFAYQYQRLINAIQTVVASSDLNNSGGSKRAILIALQRMRFQQFSYFFGGLIASLIWLLNITRVVLPVYWYCLIHFGIESVALGVFLLGFVFSTKAGKDQKRNVGEEEEPREDVSSFTKHGGQQQGVTSSIHHSPKQQQAHFSISAYNSIGAAKDVEKLM